jgi:uncharacterized protein (DUF1330 family)
MFERDLRIPVMPKGYWITFYHSVSNPAVLPDYVKLATPVVQAHRGRFLSRGTAVKAYEAGIPERSVVVEFDSVKEAIAAYESPEYKEAIKVLGDVKRDVRILEGVS